MSHLTPILAVLIATCSATPLVAETGSASISWRFLGNDTPAVGVCSAELTLAPVGPLAAPGREGHLYFNFGRKPAEGFNAPDGCDYAHVNGDLFRLTFKTLILKNEVLRFRMVSKGAVRSLTDAPSGFFQVARGADGVETVTPLEVDIDLSVLREEQLASRVESAESLPATPHTDTTRALAPVVPQPMRYEEHSEVVGLSGLPIVSNNEHASAARLLSDAIVARGGATPTLLETFDPKRPAIRLETGTVRVGGRPQVNGDEAYTLEVRPKSGVQVTGSGPAGLYYGVQTLVALLENTPARSEQGADPVLPAMMVQDAPQFQYRGLHLDVARNFQSLSTVRKLLDLMAAYKLNRFHLHLTDDEGWRLAIRGLPELTSLGGRRGYSPDFREFLPPSFGSGPDSSSAPGSGYYTREKFVSLLRYAAERHIEVIPEIDLPGHARAAIRSMQARYERLLSEDEPTAAKRFLLRRPDDDAVYESVQMWDDNVVDVRLESTHTFVEHVVGEVAGMFAEAGLPLRTLHLGGDEVPSGCWGEQTDEEVNALFVSFMDRCAEIVQSHGARPGGWEEVFTHRDDGSGLRRGAASVGLCYVWNNIWGWGQEDAAYRLANAGTDVVLCGATHLYFDLACQRDVDEPGYYWAGTTDTKEVFHFRPYTYFEGLVQDQAGNAVSDQAKQHKASLTEEGRSRVAGIQGHLWGENLISADRLEYMAFPRVLALAERAWVGPPDAKSRDGDPSRTWEQFASHLGCRELPRLDRSFGGLEYRVPSVRAVATDGMIETVSELPGMIVRYTTDGSDPTQASKRCGAKLPADVAYRFRAFDTRNRGGPTATWLPNSNADSQDDTH